MRTILVLAILMSTPGSVLGTPSPGEQARAENHALQAKAFYEAAVYDEAAAEFLKAYELAPAPKLLVNVGLCYRKLGQREKALEYFRKYLALDPNGKMKGAIQVRGIPHCLVMDRNWIVRWQGHPASLDAGTLEKIVKANGGAAASAGKPKSGNAKRKSWTGA